MKKYALKIPIYCLQAMMVILDDLCQALGWRRLQGSYRSWKTWKVMEFVISISRPGKSSNLSEGHGKSWESNMLGRQMF